MVLGQLGPQFNIVSFLRCDLHGAARSTQPLTYNPLKLAYYMYMYDAVRTTYLQHLGPASASV